MSLAKGYGAAMLLCFACAPAAYSQADPAQDTAKPGIPSVDSIAIPDLSSASDPKVRKQGWKYFFFHKKGVSFEEAAADFAECYRFLPTFAGGGELPKFIPWGKPVISGEGKPPSPFDSFTPTYGLVGVAIAAVIDGPLTRRAYQSRMRRCMEPRGYDRYPLAKDKWQELSGGYSANSIFVKAKVASSPVPDTQPLETSR